MRDIATWARQVCKLAAFACRADRGLDDDYAISRLRGDSGWRRRHLKAAQQAYELTRRSYEAGVLSQLEVNTALTQAQTARAIVRPLEEDMFR